MYRVVRLGEPGEEEAGEDQGRGGGSLNTLEEGEGGEEGDGLINLHQWQASSSSTISFDVRGELYEGEEGSEEAIENRAEVSVEIYNPTVSIGGGGWAVTEGSGAPINFVVGRDEPTGYIGTTNGDDEIPDTNVSMAVGGDAVQADYTGTLLGTVDLTMAASSKLFSITPVADTLFTEATETVTWTVLTGTGYTPPAAPQNVAAGAIANAPLVMTYSVPGAQGTAVGNRLPITAGNNVVWNGILATSDGQPQNTLSFTAIAQGAPGITATVGKIAGNQGGTYSVDITVAATVAAGNFYSLKVTCDQDPNAGPLYIYLAIS